MSEEGTLSGILGVIECVVGLPPGSLSPAIVVEEAFMVLSPQLHTLNNLDCMFRGPMMLGW